MIMVTGISVECIILEYGFVASSIEVQAFAGF